MDIILESLRAITIGFVFIFLVLVSKENNTVIKQSPGWKYIVSGFSFVFLGTLIDITDNFESLNRFIIIGDTEYQAFIEKIIGYLLGFLLIAIGFWKWLPQIIENERRSTEEINILTGILPICSGCNKIRDDEGYWNRVEAYIETHSEAEFSHGMCPQCTEKFYGDELRSLRKNKKQSITSFNVL